MGFTPAGALLVVEVFNSLSAIQHVTPEKSLGGINVTGLIMNI